MKYLSFAAILLASAFLSGCLVEASDSNVSAFCRAGASNGTPPEYRCTFSNNASITIPVCVSAKFSPGGAEAARICTTVPAMDTITKSSALAEAPESCVKGGEFVCKVEYELERIKDAVEEAPKKAEKGEAAEGEAKAH